MSELTEIISCLVSRVAAGLAVLLPSHVTAVKLYGARSVKAGAHGHFGSMFQFPITKDGVHGSALQLRAVLLVASRLNCGPRDNPC